MAQKHVKLSVTMQIYRDNSNGILFKLRVKTDFFFFLKRSYFYKAHYPIGLLLSEMIGYIGEA